MKTILNKNFLDKMFQAKSEFHKLQAQESIEIKVKKLVELQKIYYNILKSTGRELPEGLQVWELK